EERRSARTARKHGLRLAVACSGVVNRPRVAVPGAGQRDSGSGSSPAPSAPGFPGGELVGDPERLSGMSASTRRLGGRLHALPIATILKAWQARAGWFPLQPWIATRI